MLDAAVEVFGERGFTAATMAEIVERSGVSVGSIYHHFGGKSEVFNAIWEDFVALLRGRVDEVVQAARQGGEVDGFELFVLGTREYLWLIWENRVQARVIAMGDTPPGFDAQRRRASRVGGDSEIAILGLGPTRRERLFGDFLIAMRNETTIALFGTETEHEAEALIAETEKYFRRLAADV
ncbi:MULTISPECIES: helix-turn-helix domain-containing protein [Rhodococcus]|uniref:helix-turn-helix domain-containing protein n=1 Tax=Rhodococcus TaxID=1827 RepID=UPI0015C43C2D|nr:MULTISPECIES: TetR/AcrR family transcriptional regulator [Rhodococcus]MBF4478625.1 TetR/AcrR family transcriptional regulator [Rhodococcus rhodochrous]MCB8913505.1 TetR/AcrR family transcriptional regulator [Rhodococcus rhodochrous]MCD2099884.1 TetR/AcrR family transcriptional regulator [Rhodococcus rhodochrous]MCD2124342.1 TetR/AcrR family transcriptional regulator [Rhodococcus rhodochrous]MCK8672094.1 TetR/AcrR family transcriptional regulator [Rhodococcus sp. HM1]